MAFFGAVTRNYQLSSWAAGNHPYGFWGIVWGGQKSSVRLLGHFLGWPQIIRTAFWAVSGAAKTHTYGHIWHFVGAVTRKPVDSVVFTRRQIMLASTSCLVLSAEGRKFSK